MWLPQRIGFNSNWFFGKWTPITESAGPFTGRNDQLTMNSNRK